MARTSQQICGATGVVAMAIAAGVSLWAPPAGAAVKTWNGASTTWTTSSNWLPTGVPATGDTVVFDEGSQNALIAVDTTVARMIVQSSYTGKPTTSGGATYVLTNLAITDGLIGYWRFEETTGSVAADHSGFGTDLTYLSTKEPAPSTNKPTTSFTNARSLAFTSGDALVKTLYPTQLEAAAWTISAFVVKSTTFGTGDCGVGAGIKGSELLSLGDDLGLRICANGKVRVYKDTTSGGYDECDSSNTLTPGAAWHHVAATNSGATLNLYVNGTKTVCGGGGTQAYPNGTTLRIGKHATGDQYDFDGIIDELRWYNRALSDNEIAALRAGDHPPASTVLQNVSGAYDMSNDLIIAGQRIQHGDMNVGGSFYNFNSTTNATNPIVLDGSGTKEVGGFGGFVHALTIGGTATRTLTDRLVVRGALLISSPTIISNQTVYAGTVTHTAGTLTTTGSTVVADHGAAQTLRVTTSALNNLSIGDASRANLLGYWKLDEGTLTTAADSSGNGRTGTLSGGTWFPLIPTTTNITFTNPNALTFDGTDDRVSFPFATYYPAITISAWIYMTGAGEASYPRVVQLPFMNLTVRSADGDRLGTDVDFSTTDASWKSDRGIARDTWQHVAITYSGTATTDLPELYINGIAQTITTATTPVGTRVQGTGTSYIGCALTAGTFSFAGQIDDVRVYSAVLTPEQILTLASGKGEAATFTLGANLTAAGAVTIEKGALAASSFLLTAGTSGGATTIATVKDDGTLTLGAAASALNGGLTMNAGSIVTTGAGTITLGHNGTETLDIDGTFTLGGSLNIGAKAAHVDSGGSFIMGPGTVTASENLTVNAGGTLRLNSVSATAPTISLATTKTLLVNGTLKTTMVGVSAVRPIIKATSGTFIFNVSTVAAGTAILDIDGLAVQNTTSQGLYINSHATASTTFTSFKNIDFSHSVAGVYSYLLQIDADSLNQTFDKLTFDTTNTTYNFRLKDRNGGTNTRVLVGATCTGDLDCEANDHDGDVWAGPPANDNNIDTVAANPDEDTANSALIFWSERAHSDTAGTVAGFPVATYDWNDFSFRANYVSFNNAHSNGTGDILYVRDEDGSPLYEWPLPPNGDNTNNFVGAPRWTEEGGFHYVYVIDSDGRVYKLLDNNASLALVSAAPWNNAPYRHIDGGLLATASSPLTISGSYMYWYGYGGAGATAPRMFRLGLDKSVPANPHSLGAGDLLYTAPSVASVGSVDTVFGASTKNGTNATVYKIAWNFSAVSSITVPTATVNSRVTVLAGLVYFIDETGKLWVRQAANLSTTTAPSWFYRDGTANHAPACADSAGAAGCVAKNLLVEPATAYVYYGDADGHVYCANNTSGGSACPNYPFRPGTSSDVFETAPLVRAGVLVIGATNGNVYFIDRSAGTVFRRYELGAPVSSISYTFDRNDSASGAFTIATSTAPGKLYQIRRTHVIDPSLGTP